MVDFIAILYFLLLYCNALGSGKVPQSTFGKAPQTNPDSWPRSELALELHSRSSVGVTSHLQRSRHRKQFRRKADKKKHLPLLFNGSSLALPLKLIPSLFKQLTLFNVQSWINSLNRTIILLHIMRRKKINCQFIIEEHRTHTYARTHTHTHTHTHS